MALIDWIKMVNEVYHTTVLKSRGYSMIDERGYDGVVNTYFKKIGTEKEVKIGKRTHIINENKRMTKYGIPYYVFTPSAIGEDKYGNTTVKKVDGDVLQVIVKKARLVGQITTKGGQNTIVYLAIGGLIGFLVCWIVRALMGG